MPSFARRMDAITGSATVAIGDLVARRRQEGADIVSFSLGEPDFPTPVHVREAAKTALDAGHTHYTPGAGIPELREAIAAAHQRDNRIPCEVSNVIVTPTKHAVMMSLQALVGPGDEVLVPDPGWVSYVPAVRWAGGIPVPLRAGHDEGFRISPETVQEAVTAKTQVLVLNSPSNPTGAVARPDDLKAIMQLAADHDLWVVSDEIYQKLLYEGEHLSCASLPDAFERTVTIDGVSKTYAMTGWRVGWLVAPDPVRQQVAKLQSHSVTHCTSFAQYGALAALEGPQEPVLEMRKAFAARRDVMVEGLRKLPGVTCPTPEGAFYAFPRFEAQQWGGDDETVCRRLIDEAGVATTPGSAFGRQGAGHLRFSYAASVERIQEGLERLAVLASRETVRQ